MSIGRRSVSFSIFNSRFSVLGRGKESFLFCLRMQDRELKMENETNLNLFAAIRCCTSKLSATEERAELIARSMTPGLYCARPCSKPSVVVQPKFIAQFSPV